MASQEEVGVIAVVENYRTFEKQIKTVSSDISNVGKASSDAETGSNKFSASISRMAKAAASIGAVSIVSKALVEFGKQSIELAGDLEEVESKFNAVFKDTAPTARKELETFARSINRSSNNMLGFASSIQDTLVPLGVARDRADDMSVEVVKLATDIASFNNLPTANVIADIQSALVGNGETLKKYGVVLNQAKIAQELTNMGVEAGIRAATDAQKAQAALNIIYAGTTDAQGDAARTAESYANATRSLKEAITDLQIETGKRYAPTLGVMKKEAAAVVREMADFTKVMTTLNEAVKDGTITKEQDAEISSLLRRNVINASEAMALLNDITGDTTQTTEEATDATKEYVAVIGDTGEASQRYTRSLRQQAAENVKAADTRKLLNDAHEAGIITDQTLEMFTIQLKDGTLDLSDAQVQSMRSAIESKDRQEELAEALEEQTRAANSAAVSQTSLAESLLKADAARVASEAIKGLEKAMENGAISASQYQDEVTQIQLQFGLADLKSIELARGISILNAAVDAGVIPYQNMNEAVEALSENAGQVDVSEILKDFEDAPGALEEFITGTDEASKSAAGVGDEAESSASRTRQAYDSASFTATGSNAGNALASGFDEGLSNLESAAARTPADIERSFRGIPGFDIGRDVGLNISDGLSASISDVAASAADIASAINSEMEDVVTAYVVNVRVNVTETISQESSAQSVSAAQSIAPGGVSNSQVNNFNLEAITNQSPDVIAQSFNTMRLLV